MWKTAGEDITLNIDILAGDQFAKPDVGSVFVTLRDSEGLAIPDWQHKSLPDPSGSRLDLMIPADLNMVAEDSIAARYLRVEYKVNGYQYAKSFFYRLINFLPLTSSEDGVRSRLGATRTELPDVDIDIYGAYYSLTHTYGPVLVAALKAIDMSSIFANNAVEIKAAIDCTPGLQQKLLQSESQDNATFARMKMDMDRLRELLNAQLQQELGSMTEIVSGNVGSTVPIFVLSAPADIITGA